MIKKIISTILILTVVCVLFAPDTSKATDDNAVSETSTKYLYLDNGDYLETTIVSTVFPDRSSVTAHKTTTYKNSDHESLWSVTIRATFTYTGTSSSCTYAKGESQTYSDWQVTNPTVTVSGGSATARATGRIYFLGFLISETTLSVTLTCSPTGVLS
jgi:anti-sigma-K factor RskA